MTFIIIIVITARSAATALYYPTIYLHVFVNINLMIIYTCNKLIVVILTYILIIIYYMYVVVLLSSVLTLLIVNLIIIIIISINLIN